jgi:CheY-like chemotaxis protein
MEENIRILVVDDSDPIRTGTVRILQKAGYVVNEAASGSECWEKIKDFRPDLILLDLNLPDANGLDICGNFHS